MGLVGWGLKYTVHSSWGLDYLCLGGGALKMIVLWCKALGWRPLTPDPCGAGSAQGRNEGGWRATLEAAVTRT